MQAGRSTHPCSFFSLASFLSTLTISFLSTLLSLLPPSTSSLRSASFLTGPTLPARDFWIQGMTWRGSRTPTPTRWVRSESP